MAEPVAPIASRLPAAAGPATPRASIAVPERADGPRERLAGEA